VIEPDFRPVLYITGLLLLVLGAAMGLPALADAYVGSPDASAFVAGGLVTLTAGGLLMLANRGGDVSLTAKQAFLLTNVSWIALSAFGALPFLFGVGGISYASAVFETVSGLTTTGSTVLVGLDHMPPGILLWRALLHAFGGVGIIVMAVAIFPVLRVGGMQLFRTESSERGDKIAPRPGQFAVMLFVVYGLLTIACTFAYWAAGMTLFEALLHSFASISTGGFSTRDSSFAEFPPACLVVGIVFMTAGALPFALFIRALRGEPASLWRSSQVRAFLRFLAAVIFLLALWLAATRELSLPEALLHASFNVVSVVTTTGFVSLDYQLWGPLATATFFFLTFVGGCTGSTAGAIKIFRFQLLWGLLRRTLRRLTMPHGVFRLRYEDQPVSEDVLESAVAFVFAYVGTVLLITLGLSATGLDFVTAISSSATTVSNAGPALGEIAGPAGNFSSFSDAAKWLLSLGMLLGRLELFTVFALLSRRFWRD
jgi:trk system potassium uptake protein TrkH